MNTALPITPKFLTSNRSGKRPYIKDAVPVLQALDAVNECFLSDLFGNSPHSYIKLYNHYHAQWIGACRKLARWHKLVNIDSSWFESNYKPMEFAGKGDAVMFMG